MALRVSAHHLEGVPALFRRAGKLDIPKKLSGKEKKLYDELVKESKLDIKPQNRGFFS